MNCPQCGRSVREGLRFCPDCGADVPRAEATRACPHCGAEIKGRSGFCPTCGEEAVEGGRAKRSAPRVRTKTRRPAVARWWVEQADDAQPAAEVRRPAQPAGEEETDARLGADAGAEARPAGRAEAPAERVGQADAPEPPAATELAVRADAPAGREDQQEVELKPLAERLTGPAAAAQPDARPAKATEVAPKRPVASKARAVPPGLLALGGVVAAGALVVALMLFLRPGGLELPRLGGLLARGLNSPEGAVTPEPASGPGEPGSPGGVLTATQMPTETPTPPPTATPTPTNTPPPSTPAPLVHTVRSGETLRSIAERYGVTIAQLMEANDLASDVIRAGQELVIPGQTQPTPETGPTEPTVHVVQRGENLVMIARKYSVPLVDLMAANGITDPNLIKVGQQLRIPGPGESVPTQTPVPTQALTATPTATLGPTTSETTTVDLTPTAGLTGTAVPYKFAAPSLLDPANGGVVEGAEDVVLNWTSVGLLDDHTWYVVKVWRDDPAEPTPATGWTRTTAWRIPASFQPEPGATSRRFWWSVTVMRAVEGEAPVAVSPESEQRWFEWK